MRQSWPRLVLIGTLSCSIPIAAGADDRTSGTDHPVEHESPLSAIGPRFSAGLTTFEASHDDRAVGVEARASKGYSLGVYAAWWRTGWLQLQTELLYTARESTLAETMGEMMATYSLAYLELPVLARVDLPLGSRVQPFVALGASPAVMIDARHSLGLDSSGVLRSWDLGLVAAAGARIALDRRWELTVEVRGVHGLADVFVRTPRKNRAAFLTVGVAYDLVPREPPQEPIDSPAAPETSISARGRAPARSREDDAGEARPGRTVYGLEPLACDDDGTMDRLETLWCQAQAREAETEADAGADAPYGFVGVPSEEYVREFDQQLIAMLVVGCFHAQPALLRLVADSDDQGELFQLRYTRTSRHHYTAITDLEVVYSVWEDRRLERCLASTLEGAVWHSGIDEVSSRRTMEVWFPYGLIRDVVRDIRPRRGR